MITPNTDYKRFVDDVLNKYEDFVPLRFEDINTGLPHREFVLVVYSIAKQRPKNKDIVKILWDYVRTTDKEVPEFIFEFAMEAHTTFLFNPMQTEKNMISMSKAKTGSNHELYEGDIYAISMKDNSIKAITSTAQMKELGFNPANVYNCVNGRSLSHKGYVFIRDHETANNHNEGGKE